MIAVISQSSTWTSATDEMAFSSGSRVSSATSAGENTVNSGGSGGAGSEVSRAPATS